MPEKIVPFNRTRPRESAWADFRRDLFRHLVYHPGASWFRKAIICATVEGIWAVGVYRFGRSLRARGGAAKVLWPIYRTLELLVRLISGIVLDVNSQLGPGFFVCHHGAIYVGPGVRFGPDSSIGQMCFVGAAAPFTPAPELGARVYLGAAAKVIGPVKVGSHVAIGAGAVVLSDVPDQCTVVGNPARVISKKGSEEMIYLGDGVPLLSGVAARNN
jgi:serine O-acetyltransferase